MVSDIVYVRMTSWVDITGEELPAELVRKANLEELREIYRRGVWSERPLEECKTANSAAPISVRWVVVNKGDKEHPPIDSTRAPLRSSFVLPSWADLGGFGGARGTHEERNIGEERKLGSVIGGWPV